MAGGLAGQQATAAAGEGTTTASPAAGDAELVLSELNPDVLAARRPICGRHSAPQGNEVAPMGWVGGTFSLELIHQANPQRGADILVAFPWSSEPNSFGVPGTQYRATGSGVTGPETGPGSGHGSFSPFDVTNTLVAWGVDVKHGVTSKVPAGVVDIAPTILALNGISRHIDMSWRLP